MQAWGASNILQREMQRPRMCCVLEKSKKKDSISRGPLTQWREKGRKGKKRRKVGESQRMNERKLRYCGIVVLRCRDNAFLFEPPSSAKREKKCLSRHRRDSEGKFIKMLIHRMQFFSSSSLPPPRRRGFSPPTDTTKKVLEDPSQEYTVPRLTRENDEPQRNQSPAFFMRRPN